MCIELNKNNKLLSFYKFSYTIELVYDRTGFSFKIHIFYDMGWGERDFFSKRKSSANILQESAMVWA